MEQYVMPPEAGNKNDALFVPFPVTFVYFQLARKIVSCDSQRDTVDMGE